MTLPNATKVPSWSDAVTGGGTLTQATAYYQPTLYKSTASKLVNFNPALTFDGYAPNYFTTEHRLYCNTLPFHLMTVAMDERTYKTDLRAPLGIGADGNYPAFDLQTDGISPNGWNPWMSGSSPAEWDGGNALLFNGNTGGTNRQPQIFALSSANASPTVNFSANNIVSSVNSYTQATTLDAYQQSEIGNRMFVGSSGGEYWIGKIPEVLVYTTQLTPAEQLRVNSYLATKYGITLDQRTATDYVASDGTTKFWNAASNGIYKADIGAIGRDDASGLNQKQSQSVNIQVQPIISVATLATSNSANTGTFVANKVFASWANDGKPHSYSIIYSPTSFTPAGGVGFYRMATTWRFQKTGLPDDFFVGIPASSFADRLLISNTASFVPGVNTQEVLLMPDGQGNLVTSVPVSILDGYFFTFGASEKAPGGIVSGLNMWLKADAITGDDGDNVVKWSSSVLSNPYSVSQATASQQPTLGTSTTALVNFNQSVNFKRTAGQTLVNNAINLTPGLTPSYHFIAVAKDMETAFTRSSPEFGQYNLRGILGNGSSGNNPAMDLQKDDLAPNGWNPWTDGPGEWYGGVATMYNGGGIGGRSVSSDPYTKTLPPGYESRLLNQQPQIFALGFTWAGNSTLGSTSTSKINSWVDGFKEATSNLTEYNDYTNKSYFSLGQSGGSEWWNGTINEVIQYTRELSGVEMQKVNTYLAIKYGTTLGQGNNNYTSSPVAYTANVGVNISNYNYVATDGTVIWSPTTNAGYNFDIAGIGQDNFEGLNQKQSRSVNAGLQPALGLGTVEASNDANPSVFTVDKSYMIWGSNGQPNAYTVTYAPTSFTAGAPFFRLATVWKVQETATVGTITVSVPQSSFIERLLVSNSPTFPAGTQEIAMTDDGNGNLVATIDLANGQYFTFGKSLYAPGCVSANLLTWYKADGSVATSGSAVTGWTDQYSGYDVTQATVANQPTLQPASAAFNFNPFLKFDGLNDYLTYKQGRFIATNASGTMFGAASNNIDNGGYENLTDLGIDNPHMGILNNKQIMWLNGSSPAQIDQAFNLTASRPQVYGYYFNSGSTNGGTGGGRGLRLDGTDTYFTTTASTAVGNGGPVDGMWTIGSYEGVENWNGNIAEIILYDRSLTTQEKDRVDTYLAVKYGTTLTHNYLSGAGTTIYNVSTYGNNVTGIGRDNCQQLIQKQSKSVNGTAKMTIGLSNTIVSNNATHPGSFSSDASFIVFGDNGLTGLTSFSLAATACPVPPSSDKYTNLNYKVTETGSVTSVALQFDASSLGFNAIYPLWMQVSTDAAFSSLIASVPMSVSSGIATTSYDFPANSTVYVRFAGNTTSLANVCAAPKTQTFHWNGWNYGTKLKTLYPNYQTAAQTGTTDMVMSVTVTDSGNSLLYKPSVDWWPVFDGQGLFIPRNENAASEGNIITTRMKFTDKGTSTSALAAQTVDFIIRDIDGFVGGRDIVKVYGKQGVNVITPKMSRYQPVPFDALQLNYQGNGQQAIGSNIPWDLGAWGNLYVNFDQPVEEIFVEYRKDNTYSFKVYNDIRIGAISATCKLPTPKEPLVDNVYLYKEVSPNPEKTNEEVVYKFTVQNTNCAPKTINLTDNLPGGLNWVDSTLAYPASMTVGTVNSYGGSQNLLLSNVSVAPGTSTFYISAKGTTPGEYFNQASYVVTNGTGATYLSDDPSVTGTTAQPTPLTLTQNDPDANLTMSKTVDKTTAGQNEVLTYTYTISNPNASAINTTFQDLLPGEVTFVGGSLSGLSGAYTSSTAVTPYSGSAVLSMRDLSVPANSALTFSIQTNTNSYTIGAVANNIGLVTPDINAGYRVITVKSNVASTTIVVPPTITILSPAASSTTTLNPTVSGTATPGSTVVLTGPGPATLCTTTATAGGTWSCQVNLTAGPQTLTAVATNSAGVSSPATTSFTAINQVTPLTTSNPPVQTATTGGTQAGNAATELAPMGGTTPFTYSNDTGNASCSAVPGATELPASSGLTVNSSTGSYSYTAPTTPGLYYFCIKVCDNSPTPQCVTKTYTLVVASVPASGNLNCTATQIIGAISQGTPGSGVLKISMTVSTTGTFGVTISGSGMSLQINPTNLSAPMGGLQTFYVPINYDGSTLGMLNVTIAGAGTCTYNLAGQTPTGKNQPVMDIGGSCIAITPATLGK